MSFKVTQNGGTLIVSNHAIQRSIERFPWSKDELFQKSKEAAALYFKYYHGKNTDIKIEGVIWAIEYMGPYKAAIKTIFPEPYEDYSKIS